MNRAQKLTLTISLFAAALCAGVAWYTSNSGLWILAGIALASGLGGALATGRR